jgi:hypothetical protein
LRKIVVAATFALAALIPSTALAKPGGVPATGAKKQSIVRAVAKKNQLSVSTRQASACFTARTYRGYALVMAGAGFKKHPRWYRTHGLCDIRFTNGQQWQPGGSILKRNPSGRWLLKVAFDDPPSASYLRHHGVPPSVFKKLTGNNPGM